MMMLSSRLRQLAVIGITLVVSPASASRRQDLTPGFHQDLYLPNTPSGITGNRGIPARSTAPAKPSKWGSGGDSESSSCGDLFDTPSLKSKPAKPPIRQDVELLLINAQFAFADWKRKVNDRCAQDVHSFLNNKYGWYVDICKKNDTSTTDLIKKIVDDQTFDFFHGEVALQVRETLLRQKSGKEKADAARKRSNKKPKSKSKSKKKKAPEGSKWFADELYKGWKEDKCPDTGKIYYWKKEGSVSRVSWVHPGLLPVEDKAPQKQADHGWKELVDKRSGEKYYWNEITSKTSWERPPQFSN